MRYYFFDQRFWHDRVAYYSWRDVSAGDFFEVVWMGYVICLGDHISWIEQYKKYTLPSREYEVLMIQDGCFNTKVLQWIHRFTNQWFATYKKTIPLFIWDPDAFAKYHPKKSSKKKTDIPQKLFIVPNVWTLMNTDFSSYWISDISYTLHSQSTKKQKAMMFWDINAWEPVHLVCTYSQIFQNWNNLDKIFVFDAHTWRYKHQQDPRYSLLPTINFLSTLFECEVETTWYILNNKAV